MFYYCLSSPWSISRRSSVVSIWLGGIFDAGCGPLETGLGFGGGGGGAWRWGRGGADISSGRVNSSVYMEAAAGMTGPPGAGACLMGSNSSVYTEASAGAAGPGW